MERRVLPQPTTLGPGEPVLVRLAWNVTVSGMLSIPQGAKCLVVFAHGSGVCGKDNVHLASVLNKYNVGTLLFDLLTDEEADYDEKTGDLRRDTVMLGDRLVSAIIWLEEQRHLRSLPLGLFGDDKGAAAAFVAAARLPDMVKAVVVRSGCLEETEAVCPFIKAPTLLLLGQNDSSCETSEKVLASLSCEKGLRTFDRLSDILADSEGLEFVGEMSAAWFVKHLQQLQPPARSDEISLKNDAQD